MSLQDEAEDRRPDLGWLLCTLGRHGPALLLVLVLVLVVGAGVCVYRAVTGRRRGAPARGGTPPGGGRRPGEDTDVSGEGFSDVMEDVGNLRLRRRPAAAEEEPPAHPTKIRTPETRMPSEEQEVCVEEVLEGEGKGGSSDDGDVCRGPENVRNSENADADSRTTPEKISADTRDVPEALVQKIQSPEETRDEELKAEPHPEDEGQENGPVCVGEVGEEELENGEPERSHGEASRHEESFDVPEAEGTSHPPPLCQPDSGTSPPGTLSRFSDPPAPGNAAPPAQLSFELKYDDGEAPPPGAAPESGISSLAVSPDEDGNVLGAEAAFPNGVLAEREARVMTEVTFQMSRSVRWTLEEPPAPNEDAFGHEIEDSYHSYYDRFAAEIAASVAASVAAEVVLAKEKTSGNAEEEEERERTEISIMEATMDANEWITEGGPPLPPWLRPSPPAPPTEAPPSAAPPRAAPPSPDETAEPHKRVVAVPPMPQHANVTFRVHYRTQSPHQTVAVTGDRPELGAWAEFVPLEKVREGHWSGVVSLPTEVRVAWKFVVLDKGEVWRWEECGNRLLDTGLGEDVVVHEWWGLA